MNIKKAICIIIGLISFTCIPISVSLYDSVIPSLTQCLGLALLSGCITATMMMFHSYLKYKESAHEFADYVKRIDK